MTCEQAYIEEKQREQARRDREELECLRAEVERLEAELAVFREEEAIDEIAYAEYRDAQHRIAEALGFCASWQLDIEFLLRVEQAVAALKARCARRDGDPRGLKETLERLP